MEEKVEHHGEGPSLKGGSLAGRLKIRGRTPTQADTCVSTERPSTACDSVACSNLKGLAQRRLGRKGQFSGYG